MKNFLVKGSAAVAILILAGIALTCVNPPAGHMDFNLRMNEVDCVLRGVNPFRIWNEEVVLPPYVSNLPKKEIPQGCTEQVNAYAPWTYAYMMPLSVFSRPAAWCIYCLLMGGALAALWRFSRPAEREPFPGRNAAVLAAVPLTVVSYLIWSNTSVGNFIVLVLAFSVLMCHSLAEKRWCLAGVLWALAMLKPQSALLFAVPLMMRWRWRECVVAGAVCLLASLIPAALCREPVFELLVQGPAANAELFEGCGTWPKFLCGYFSNETDILIGLAVGAVLCLWMTWLLRREKDWLVFLMPAAVVSSCWTYTQAYTHAMGWFLAYALVKELCLDPRSKAMRALMVAAIVLLPRYLLAWHGLYGYMGWDFPMSEFAYRSADSLNSTCTLALAAAFCIVKSRAGENMNAYGK